MNIMGISPKGIYFIGRRYKFNDYKNPANGLSISVSRLDPITGRTIGTINLVKWKPFVGYFETKKLINEFIDDFEKNKIKPVKFVTLNEKKYGFSDAIMVNKALKKYKISSGVAYRWMREGRSPFIMVGKNRYVPQDKFAELAAKHKYRPRDKSKKPRIKKEIAALPVEPAAHAVTITQITPKHPWWKFWK